MALTLDLSSSAVDEGDTKRLVLTPTDSDGAASSLASLVVTFTDEGGAETDYTLADATQVGDTYVVEHTFSTAGVTLVDVLAEGTQGATERESGAVIVRGKRRG